MPRETTKFNKIVFSDYKDSYSEELRAVFLAGIPLNSPIEQMRKLMYGYTFTDEYKTACSKIFDIGFWRRSDNGNVQAKLITDTILSTGDGLTPETAFCVIDVSQEYDLIREIMPFMTPDIISQSYSKGTDCLCLAKTIYGTEKLYFDISCRINI